jgi:hypothetical protein
MKLPEQQAVPSYGGFGQSMMEKLGWQKCVFAVTPGPRCARNATRIPAAVEIRECGNVGSAVSARCSWRWASPCARLTARSRRSSPPPPSGFGRFPVPRTTCVDCAAPHTHASHIAHQPAASWVQTTSGALQATDAVRRTPRRCGLHDDYTRVNVAYRFCFRRLQRVSPPLTSGQPSQYTSFWG